MVQIRVRTNAQVLSRSIRNFGLIDVPRVTARALNAGVTKGRSVAVKEVGRKFGLQKPIRRRTRILKKDRAKPRKLTAAVTGYITPLPLRLLETGRRRLRPEGRGLRLGNFATFIGGFKTTINKNKKPVEAAMRRKGKARYPIEEIRIPIAHLLGPSLREAVATEGRKRFNDRMEKGIKAEWRKRARRIRGVT